MAEHNTKTTIESVREWVVEHKLRTVGNFPQFPCFVCESDYSILYALCMYLRGLIWIFFEFDLCVKRLFVAERNYGFDRVQLVSTRHENKRQAHSC